MHDARCTMHDEQKAVYSGRAYVGVGFSSNGIMVPGDAVIGLPDEDTAVEYDLGGYVSTFLWMVLLRFHCVSGVVPRTHFSLGRCCGGRTQVGCATLYDGTLSAEPPLGADIARDIDLYKVMLS